MMVAVNSAASGWWGVARWRSFDVVGCPVVSAGGLNPGARLAQAGGVGSGDVFQPPAQAVGVRTVRPLPRGRALTLLGVWCGRNASGPLGFGVLQGGAHLLGVDLNHGPVLAVLGLGARRDLERNPALVTFALFTGLFSALDCRLWWGWRLDGGYRLRPRRVRAARRALASSRGESAGWSAVTAVTA